MEPHEVTEENRKHVFSNLYPKADYNSKPRTQRTRGQELNNRHYSFLELLTIFNLCDIFWQIECCIYVVTK